MNTAGWSANEILSRGIDYHNMALQAFNDPILKQTLGAQLVDGALIGREGCGDPGPDQNSERKGRARGSRS